MKKRIIALFLAVASIAATTACNEHDLGGDVNNSASSEVQSDKEAIASHTVDPSVTYKDPEPINGTYDAYGCTDLLHGDYRINSNVNIYKDGKKITKDELKKGDIIAVYFSGLIAESYPAQPSGVTKIEVVTGDPEEYKQAGGTSCIILEVNCLAYGIYANEIRKFEIVD